MGYLGNQIAQNVVSPAAENTGDYRTVGAVKSIDESKNICEVIITKNNRNIKIPCTIELNIKKFPKVKDLVLVTYDNSGRGFVHSIYTEDYERDVKSKQQLKNDIMNDGDSTVVGGQIY